MSASKQLLVSKVDDDTLLVKYKRPDKASYYHHDNCPPLQRGDDCYGDCFDCYDEESERFEQLMLVAENML